MSEKEIWDKVLEIAQERISNTSYQTFIKDTQLYSLKNDEAIILVSLPFNASWLNQRYSEIMQAIIYDVIGYEVKPHFISEDELTSYNNVNTQEVQEPQIQNSYKNLVLMANMKNCIHSGIN